MTCCWNQTLTFFAAHQHLCPERHLWRNGWSAVVRRQTDPCSRPGGVHEWRAVQTSATRPRRGARLCGLTRSALPNLVLRVRAHSTSGEQGPVLREPNSLLHGSRPAPVVKWNIPRNLFFSGGHYLRARHKNRKVKSNTQLRSENHLLPSR